MLTPGKGLAIALTFNPSSIHFNREYLLVLFCRRGLVYLHLGVSEVPLKELAVPSEMPHFFYLSREIKQGYKA